MISLEEHPPYILNITLNPSHNFIKKSQLKLNRCNYFLIVFLYISPNLLRSCVVLIHMFLLCSCYCSDIAFITYVNKASHLLLFSIILWLYVLTYGLFTLSPYPRCNKYCNILLFLYLYSHIIEILSVTYLFKNYYFIYSSFCSQVAPLPHLAPGNKVCIYIPLILKYFLWFWLV